MPMLALTEHVLRSVLGPCYFTERSDEIERGRKEQGLVPENVRVRAALTAVISFILIGRLVHSKRLIRLALHALIRAVPEGTKQTKHGAEFKRQRKSGTFVSNGTSRCVRLDRCPGSMSGTNPLFHCVPSRAD